MCLLPDLNAGYFPTGHVHDLLFCCVIGAVAPSVFVIVVFITLTLWFYVIPAKLFLLSSFILLSLFTVTPFYVFGSILRVFEAKKVCDDSPLDQVDQVFLRDLVYISAHQITLSFYFNSKMGGCYRGGL